MGFPLHNVSDVTAVRPYLRRKHIGEVTFSAPASVARGGGTSVPEGLIFIYRFIPSACDLRPFAEFEPTHTLFVYLVDEFFDAS